MWTVVTVLTSEHTRNHGLVCFTWMDFTVCKLHLSRIVKNNRGNWVWGLWEFCIPSSHFLCNSRTLYNKMKHPLKGTRHTSSVGLHGLTTERQCWERSSRFLEKEAAFCLPQHLLPCTEASPSALTTRHSECRNVTGCHLGLCEVEDTRGQSPEVGS